MNRKDNIFYERYASGDFSVKKMEQYNRKMTKNDKEIIKVIKKENDYVRKIYPIDIYKHWILQKAKIRSQLTIKKVYRLLQISIPVCICFILFFISTITFLKPDNIIRPKGKKNPSLYIYKQTLKNPKQIHNFSYVEHGDRLQITYIPGTAKYGFVFSIDGRKKVTFIHPAPEEDQFQEEITRAFLLESNAEKEVPLPYSYTLDDAPEFEVIFFITSNTQFNPQEKVEQILSSFSFNSSDFSPNGELEFIILLKKEKKDE
jgi:hypothetical protein